MNGKGKVFNRSWFIFSWLFFLTNTAQAVWNGVLTVHDAVPDRFFESTFDISTDTSECSGTFIHPQIMITAAHCLNEDAVLQYFLNGTSKRGINQTLIQLQKTAPENGFSFLADADTKFNYDSRFSERGPYLNSVGHDVGYIYFKTPVLKIKPSRFLFLGLSPLLKNPLGLPIEFAGFGLSHPGETLNEPTSGYKRMGNKTISDFAPEWFNSEGGELAPLSGDSGAGVFTEVQGERYLVGIVSGGNWDKIKDKAELVSNYVTLRPEIICWIQKETAVDLGEKNCH